MHACVFERKSLWRRTGRHRRRGPTFGVIRMKIEFGRIVAQPDSGIENSCNPRSRTLNRSVRSFGHHFPTSFRFSKQIPSSAGHSVKCSLVLASKVLPLSSSAGEKLMSNIMTNRATVIRMFIRARGRPMQP